MASYRLGSNKASTTPKLVSFGGNSKFPDEYPRLFHKGVPLGNVSSHYFFARILALPLPWKSSCPFRKRMDKIHSYLINPNHTGVSNLVCKNAIEARFIVEIPKVEFYLIFLKFDNLWNLAKFFYYLLLKKDLKECFLVIRININISWNWSAFYILFLVKLHPYLYLIRFNYISFYLNGLCYFFAYQRSSEVLLHILSYSSRRACPVLSTERISGLEHTMTSMKVLLYSRWGYFLQIDGQQRIRGLRTKDDYCGKRFRTLRPEIWLCDCTMRYNYLIIDFCG